MLLTRAPGRRAIGRMLLAGALRRSVCREAALRRRGCAEEFPSPREMSLHGLPLLRHSKSFGPSAPIAYATCVSPPDEAAAWPGAGVRWQMRLPHRGKSHCGERATGNVPPENVPPGNAPHGNATRGTHHMGAHHMGTHCAENIIRRL